MIFTLRASLSAVPESPFALNEVTSHRPSLKDLIAELSQERD